MKAPTAVVLLGAQRFDPTLGAAVSNLRVSGRIALITAGWQEREHEDEELSAHLGGNTVNLRLHWRGDEVFKADPELRAAHRERQDSLRHRQDFYRIRLEHLFLAERVMEKRATPPDISHDEAEVSLQALRDLDAAHLAQCARLHAEFDERWKPRERAAVAKHREELHKAVHGCAAVAIAGGHVASLLNRLKLFGVEDLLGGRLVFAWSAGAMALSDRVVLYHDDPPQGPGVSEVLDAGLGLVPGVVVLPDPEHRLDLKRKERVRTLVSRFAPARCLSMPARSRLTFRGKRLGSPVGVMELGADGAAAPMREA